VSTIWPSGIENVKKFDYVKLILDVAIDKKGLPSIAMMRGSKYVRKFLARRQSISVFFNLFYNLIR
jgi:hypothetical protein